MLFNSFAFLLVFLPASLAAYALIGRFAPRWRLPGLLLLSFVFYGYWDWRFLPLMAGSIAFNWLAAWLYGVTRRAWLVWAAIAADLLVLGLFKYEGFFAQTAQALSGLPVPAVDWLLPLGISFFTFHHVMYLTDLRRGQAPVVGLTRYGLYIAFFPQVLSGPLVRWREILHQFERDPFVPGWEEPVARGLLLLILGLAKKVFLADPLADYAAPAFAAAASGGAPAFAQAWNAALAFTFQIYFDFSGYTDMALGVALMFGIMLPQNFDAPYRAASLRDFWRRWHMTLSRFLRDYLYIPLGGSRHGLPRQIGAVLATMTLGGLWHGAGLTFVAWGALHGAALSAGVLWRRTGLAVASWIAGLATFAFVVLTWVLFRSQSIPAALHMYRGLFGFGAPGGAHLRWRAILLAAIFAVLGPTSWTLVSRAGAWRWLAVAAAVLAVLELLKLGDVVSYEFIYFRF